MILITAALALAPQASAVTLQTPKVVQGLRPIAFAPAPSGPQVAMSLEDGSVRIMNIENRVTVRELAKHPQPAYAIDWSQDGNTIATGDETARIWIENARTGAKIREYRTHTRGIQKIAFNANGTRVATTGKDDFIKIYDLLDPKPKEALAIAGSGANFYGAEFNPRSPAILATGILGPGGRTYDSVTGKLLGLFSDPVGLGVFDVAYNPVGSRMVTAGRDGNVVVWDPAVAHKRLGSLKGHQDFVMDVAFAPNGRLAASGSTDATVKLWSVVTMQKVGELTGQSYVGSPVAFTADGKFLLTVNDAGFLQINPLSPAQAGTVVPAPAKTAPAKKKRTRRRR